MRLFFITFTLFLFLNELALAQDYFQQDVEYKIDITLNTESKTYSGTEYLYYKNNSRDTLNYIWLHLYPNAYLDESTPFAKQQALRRHRTFHFSEATERGYLNLDSVKSGFETLIWEYKPNAIDEVKIFLPMPLEPGQSADLKIVFDGKFPKLFSRMCYFRNTHFAATQWYPKVVVYDKFGWHPDSYLDMGEFYGEFAKFDVSITLPKYFVIEATGMLVENPKEEAFIKSIVDSTKKLISIESKKERKKFIKKWIEDRKCLNNSDSIKTVRFVAENVHDFAWFTGNTYMMLQSTHNDGVLTNVLVYPEDAYDWREMPRYIEQTISFYSKQVGKYKYPKASAVEGGVEAGSAMEYPMVTNISLPNMEWMNILEMAVMHEVGHNWFYGMLGSNERRDTFLDEGLNSFYEYKYMQTYHGRNNYSNFNALLHKFNFLEDFGEWHIMQLVYGITVNENTSQPLKLRAEEFSPASYGAIAYYKSVMLLLSLEWLVGEDDFKQGIQTYFDRWSGKHPTREDFFNIMEEVSGQDLDWFIEEWYNGTSYNDFKITKTKTEKKDNKFITKIYVKNKGTMKNMPAPVHLVTTTNDTIEGRWSGNEDKPVEITHADPADKIEVNLNRAIYESNYLNNTNFPDFDFNFIGQFPRFDTYAINILPYYWYESYKDKFRLGLGFWSGNPFFKQYFAHGSGYYGTGSGNIGYDFNITNRYNSFFSNFIDIGATVKDMDGLKRYSAELKSVSINPEDSRYHYLFKLNIDNIKLYDLTYNDHSAFQKTRYSTVSLTFFNKFRRMLYYYTTQLSIEKAVDILDSETDYTKAEIEFFYKRYLTKKSEIKFKLYGAGLWGSDIPTQELIYAGGDNDPKHKRFALSRRGGKLH